MPAIRLSYSQLLLLCLFSITPWLSVRLGFDMVIEPYIKYTVEKTGEITQFGVRLQYCIMF